MRIIPPIISCIFLLVLAACGRENPLPLNPQKIGQPIDWKIVRANHDRACYPGKEMQDQECLATLEKTQINNPDYEYVNPYTDPEFPAHLIKEMYKPPLRLIDLTYLDPSMSLTKNFQLEEIMSLQKGQFGLFSVPVIKVFQQLRQNIGVPIFITSAYRNPSYNAGTQGAARWSRHMYGDAIDFFADALTLSQLRDECLKFGASFYQLYEHHIHCDWRGVAQDPNFFLEKSLRADWKEEITIQAYNEYYANRLQVEMTTLQNTSGNEDVIFQVEQPEKEDSEDLLHEWKVYLPSGAVYESQDIVIRVPKEIGVYRVFVQLGGSLTLPLHQFVVSK